MLGVPLRVLAVILRHVLGHGRVLAGLAVAPDMRGDAVALEKDFNCALGHAHVHLVFDVFVGHGVLHFVHGDVIVECQGSDLPDGKFKRARWQRQQEWLLLLQERTQAAAGSFLEWLAVELIQLLKHGLVQLMQREKLAVAQRGDDLSGDDTHRTLHARLVLRLANAGGDDRRAIMPRHLVVGSIDDRRVPRRAIHSRLQVIRYQNARHAAEAPVHIRMRADPCLLILRKKRLDIRVSAAREHRHKYIRSNDLSREIVDDPQCPTCPVHFCLLARLALDVHRRLVYGGIVPVVLAELRVHERDVPISAALLTCQRRGEMTQRTPVNPTPEWSPEESEKRRIFCGL